MFITVSNDTLNAEAIIEVLPVFSRSSWEWPSVHHLEVPQGVNPVTVITFGPLEITYNKLRA